MIEFVCSWRFFGGFVAGLTAGGLGAVVALALGQAAASGDHYPSIEDAEQQYRPARNVTRFVPRTKGE